MWGMKSSIVIPHKKNYKTIYVNIGYKKEMWIVVHLSHIENVRSNSYRCKLYIVVSHRKIKKQSM